jgi:hypothetical protein
LSDDRNLTDKDVEAIVDALESRFAQKFYADLGKGLWAAVWRTMVTLALVVAAYGATKGFPR